MTLFSLFFGKKYVEKGYFKLVKREYENYDENYNHICLSGHITSDNKVNVTIIEYIEILKDNNIIEIIS